jgi:hypothetical protein
MEKPTTPFTSGETMGLIPQSQENLAFSREDLRAGAKRLSTKRCPSKK